MPFSLTNKEYYSHISKKSKVDIDAVNSLKDAGFNLMSLANNHIMDYDLPVLQIQFRYLVMLV